MKCIIYKCYKGKDEDSEYSAWLKKLIDNFNY